MEVNLKHFPQSLADAIGQDPQTRTEGALRLSRHILGVDALALTLVPPFDNKPRLVAHDGYEADVARVYTEEWFGLTPRRIRRHQHDPKRLYPWDRSEFADTPYASETLMPAGYRNGITYPLTSTHGIIFGFIHTNITRLKFETETQEMLRETADQLADAAYVLYERFSTGLTSREREIITYIREGLSNPEIASTLYVSPRTISTHVDHILKKTGSINRSQAAAWAVRHGF
ncbi:LuxR C-terminal-related transcriptional regulator [Nesterenkonia sp. NBAIMH1]|uniref:helix-turn-helix transcriptional regulator n=1 Tax=Nesterenkonia sp. NBAIMH1 TaxID=2600320 RepID=UPI0011B80073|nr:LuxR C-terminal-related transcriptional regulator [Nesterenkonia sp. NBAIMH1]